MVFNLNVISMIKDYYPFKVWVIARFNNEVTHLRTYPELPHL